MLNHHLNPYTWHSEGHWHSVLPRPWYSRHLFDFVLIVQDCRHPVAYVPHSMVDYYVFFRKMYHYYFLCCLQSCWCNCTSVQYQHTGYYDLPAAYWWHWPTKDALLVAGYQLRRLTPFPLTFFSDSFSFLFPCWLLPLCLIHRR